MIKIFQAWCWWTKRRN